MAQPETAEMRTALLRWRLLSTMASECLDGRIEALRDRLSEYQQNCDDNLERLERSFMTASTEDALPREPSAATESLARSLMAWAHGLGLAHAPWSCGYGLRVLLVLTQPANGCGAATVQEGIDYLIRPANGARFGLWALPLCSVPMVRGLMLASDAGHVTACIMEEIRLMPLVAGLTSGENRPLKRPALRAPELGEAWEDYETYVTSYMKAYRERVTEWRTAHGLTVTDTKHRLEKHLKWAAWRLLDRLSDRAIADRELPDSRPDASVKFPADDNVNKAMQRMGVQLGLSLSLPDISPVPEKS